MMEEVLGQHMDHLFFRLAAREGQWRKTDRQANRQTDIKYTLKQTEADKQTKTAKYRQTDQTVTQAAPYVDRNRAAEKGRYKHMPMQKKWRRDRQHELCSHVNTPAGRCTRIGAYLHADYQKHYDRYRQTEYTRLYTQRHVHRQRNVDGHAGKQKMKACEKEEA